MNNQENQEKKVKQLVISDLNFDNPKKNFELYTVKDKKTNKFMPPFFASNTDEAKRSISNTVNYSNSLINKFPQDYELYYVGEFSEDSGQVFSVVNHDIIDSTGIIFICSLDSLKTEDTIKFDELLKETKSLQLSISSVLQDYDNVHADYEKKLRELSILEDQIKAKHAKNDVDCFPIKSEKKLTLKKKGILDKLFS